VFRMLRSGSFKTMVTMMTSMNHTAKKMKNYQVWMS